MRCENSQAMLLNKLNINLTIITITDGGSYVSMLRSEVLSGTGVIEHLLVSVHQPKRATTLNIMIIRTLKQFNETKLVC